MYELERHRRYRAAAAAAAAADAAAANNGCSPLVVFLYLFVLDVDRVRLGFEGPLSLSGGW